MQSSLEEICYFVCHVYIYAVFPALFRLCVFRLVCCNPLQTFLFFFLPTSLQFRIISRHQTYITFIYPVMSGIQRWCFENELPQKLQEFYQPILIIICKRKKWVNINGAYNLCYPDELLIGFSWKKFLTKYRYLIFSRCVKFVTVFVKGSHDVLFFHCLIHMF